jgi:predicted secreted protein
MRRRAFAALSIAAIALAGCAGIGKYPGTPEDPPLRLAESDAGRTIQMERGKRITLRLEANHSAGYRWSFAASGDGELAQLGEPFYTAEQSVAGGGGAEYWSFRATRSGKAELRFEYRRTWEKDKPAGKVLNYTINITSR